MIRKKQEQKILLINTTRKSRDHNIFILFLLKLEVEPITSEGVQILTPYNTTTEQKTISHKKK